MSCAGNFPDGENSEANGGGARDGGALFDIICVWRSTDSSVTHGGEAVVGRRDANWAQGNSAFTNILLLSAVWVVGAVFANRNAPALGRILNQQRVGNLTLGVPRAQPMLWTKVKNKTIRVLLASGSSGSGDLFFVKKGSIKHISIVKQAVPQLWGTSNVPRTHKTQKPNVSQGLYQSYY